MSETTFDTLMYSKKLREAGFTEQQAEIQAEAIKELIDDKLVTKNDLKIGLRSLRDQMTIRMGGMLVTAVVVQSAVMGLLAFLLK